MNGDLRKLLPRDKTDLASARAVIELGFPAVEPVLPDMLEWLQDCNWPVSWPISEFLATLPEPMVPLVWNVLQGDDHIWKYWCILRIIRAMPPSIAEQFRPELNRLAEVPSVAERLELLDEVAKDALRTLWPT